MKKLFFAFVFIFAAAVLCGCDSGGKTREVMFTENPPNITTVTMTTTSFADTFGEYMATYSRSETSESGSGSDFSRPQGVVPDTVFRGGGAEQVSRDTAARFTHSGSAEVSDFTDNSQNFQVTAVTEVPETESETVTTSVVETTAEITAETGSTSVTTTVTTLSVPRDTAFRDSAHHNNAPRDTAFSPAVSADTAYSNTTNGGSTNAD